MVPLNDREYLVLYLAELHSFCQRDAKINYLQNRCQTFVFYNPLRLSLQHLRTTNQCIVIRLTTTPRKSRTTKRIKILFEQINYVAKVSKRQKFLFSVENRGGTTMARNIDLCCAFLEPSYHYFGDSSARIISKR